MKKTLIAVAIVVVFAAYAIYQHNQNAKNNNVAVLDTNTNQTPASDSPPTTPSPAPASPSPTPNPSPATVPTPATAPNGQFKDGQYTGSVADAFYGSIQVKAVIQGGKLSDVQFLQYPSDRGESIQISSHMMPILTSEAIKAQSANVDAVSGATQDSEAFTQSLQSALNQAKA